MDEDLDGLSRQQLLDEVRRLRSGIRAHRDSSGHDLCWHHPELWGLLPEQMSSQVAVPEWPAFLRGCVAYRQSLDAQLPDAPVHHREYGDPGPAAAAPVNLWDALERIPRPWSPHLVASVNDHRLKAVRVAGEFVWHSHPGMDELFVVLDGELTIDLREPSGTGTGERAVVLRAGDVYTVPADVPHRPRSAGGARLLLVEPAGMVNTGDFTGAVPEHIDRTEGRPL